MILLLHHHKVCSILSAIASLMTCSADCGHQWAPAQCKSLLALQVSTDWVGLIDEWATRFFHELDYKREAQNSITFAQQMLDLEGIMVSEVFPQLSTRNVLTTGWVKGMPLAFLSESQACDLC